MNPLISTFIVRRESQYSQHFLGNYSNLVRSHITMELEVIYDEKERIVEEIQ